MRLEGHQDSGAQHGAWHRLSSHGLRRLFPLTPLFNIFPCHVCSLETSGAPHVPPKTWFCTKLGPFPKGATHPLGVMCAVLTNRDVCFNSHLLFTGCMIWDKLLSFSCVSFLHHEKD